MTLRRYVYEMFTGMANWRINLPGIFVLISMCSLLLQVFLFHREIYVYRRVPQNVNEFDTRNKTAYAHQTEAPPPTYKDFLDKPSADLTNMSKTWRYNAMIYKQEAFKPRFLTIGIPTIKRVQDEYIIGTIHSIINCTSKEELKGIYIVIFLADFDDTWRKNISERLFHAYSDLVEDGTLQIIEAYKSFYPPLENLVHTYNDPVQQRKWKSKQNADYAFLFLYSQHLATYYIQMEDDIYTIPGYLKVIKDYMAEFKNPWTCLEFSELGFIGKLYHSKDLEKLAKMVLLFYEEQPCDFTFLYFNIQMLQFYRYIHKPSIFQHVGIHSSLPGKIQPLKDRFFDDFSKKYKGDNPPAKIYTNMPTNPDFKPEMAYDTKDGYFWSKGNAAKGEMFVVVFDEPQHVDSIIINTGSREHLTDKIENGKVEASLSFIGMDQSMPKCTNDIFLGIFENGSIHVQHLRQKIDPFKIHCIRITITSNQNWWIIIKEIAIFTEPQKSILQTSNTSKPPTKTTKTTKTTAKH